MSPHRLRPRRPTRVLALLVSSVVVLASLAACSGDGEDGAQAEAEAVAEALSTGDISAALGAEAQEEYAAVVSDLRADLGEGESPSVTVASLTEAGESEREATLTWSWPVEGFTWTTEGVLTLTRDDSEEWSGSWDTRVVDDELLPGETLTARGLAPTRGRILGADGVALVKPRTVVRYGLDKTQLRPGQVASSARAVARVFDLEVGPYVRAAQAAGEKAFVEAIALREADSLEVPASFEEIPGAAAIADTLPLAPTRAFAAPILGRVGPVTAELIEESDGALQIGDEVGLSGLQARYDDQLRGSPGFRVLAVADDGGERELFREDATDGEPLRLTLDLRQQLRAERILADVGPASALVAIRPSDGAILAAASGPGGEGLNTATFGQYAPGSTFKLVSTLALLRNGLGPEAAVDCPASTVVDGKAFSNYSDYPSGGLGRITLRQALANSCNTAFITSRDRLSDGDLAAAAASLGLGVDQDLGFPAYFGEVPAPQSETEAAADLIGQGRVLASPMIMAGVAASIADGRTVVPWLVEGFRPEADPEVPLTAAEARSLRSLMRSVVTSGSGSVLAGIPGEVGAKTGTAEYGEPGPGGALRTHAWMVATRGDLAVAAFVEDGESGSRTAGPLMAAFLG